MRYLACWLSVVLLAFACSGPGARGSEVSSASRPEVRYYVIAET